MNPPHCTRSNPSPLDTGFAICETHITTRPLSFSVTHAIKNRYVSLRAALLGLRMGDEAGSPVFSTQPFGFRYGSTALMCISASAILSGWILEASARCCLSRCIVVPCRKLQR